MRGVFALAVLVASLGIEDPVATPVIAGLTPTNIVVRNNLLSKPLAWRDKGAPAWQVKNLFELKNARRVLIEQRHGAVVAALTCWV